MADTPVLIVPAYNEADTLPGLLDELARHLPELPVVVIDDGSSDGTAALAARGGAHVVRHPQNLGYGAAVQTGYKWALRRGAPAAAQLDADGQHRPEEIPALLEPVLRGDCDLALGSRFLEPGSYRMGTVRAFGSRMLRALARWYGLEVSDPTSGFQALGPRALALFAEDGFPSDYPDIDVLLYARRAGLRIAERPVRMLEAPRESTLHSGWKPIYYAYKMLLSVWAATSRRR